MTLLATCGTNHRKLPPEFFAEIDRARAAELGLNANEIAINLNTSLSSSEQVEPNFWTDPKSGIPYYLVAHTPEPQMGSLNALADTPVTAALSPHGQPVPGLLRNVATLTRTTVPTNANQANIQPVYEVYANAQGRDLSSIAGDIDKIVAELRSQLSPGNTIQVTGQIAERPLMHSERLPRCPLQAPHLACPHIPIASWQCCTHHQGRR